MGAQCSRTVVDVIPDKTVMMEAVEAIVAFEELLKKGQDLNRTQKRELKRVTAVSREMKKLASTTRPNQSGIIFSSASLVREGVQ